MNISLLEGWEETEGRWSFVHVLKEILTHFREHLAKPPCSEQKPQLLIHGSFKLLSRVLNDLMI